MGTVPKEFTQTTPDATLKALAYKGKNGTGGLARLAHVNKVIEALTLPAYEEEVDATNAGLVTGDLYQTTGGGAANPHDLGAGIVLVVQ